MDSMVDVQQFISARSTFGYPPDELNSRILSGFHSLVKTKYMFPELDRATHNIIYSKHASCTKIMW